MLLQSEFIVNKFISRIKFPDNWSGCWIWPTTSKYGLFYYSKWWCTTAHRACIEIITGERISRLYVVDHKCKVTQCVNPLHLEIVTQQINLARGNTVNAINIAKTECKNGHEYDDKNTHVDKLGKRHCRKCDALRKRGLL